MKPVPTRPAYDERAIDHVGELQRADVAARALWLRETDDDEVASPLGFDLEPHVTAPAAIRRVAALGDHALESQRRHLREERFTFALDVIERADCAELWQRFHEQRFAGRRAVADGDQSLRKPEKSNAKNVAGSSTAARLMSIVELSRPRC